MKKGFTWLYPLTPTHLRGNSGHGSGSVTQSDDKAMSPMMVIGDVNITAAAGGAAVSAMTHLSSGVLCANAVQQWPRISYVMLSTLDRACSAARPLPVMRVDALYPPAAL